MANHTCAVLCGGRISLVNESVLSHFMAELDMNKHFTMLRRYMLMEDGEFSQSLADQLFEKVCGYTRANLCGYVHFTMLRRYMLMEDGEFSQSLADQLFEKVCGYIKLYVVIYTWCGYVPM